MLNQTYRPVAPGMEPHIGFEHRLLDHGYIRVIDYMGDDAAVVQAARVSYGAGTKAVSSDEGLIRYLMRHRHSTPFEMAEIKIHVKLPIFVARQWVRHRAASINEISARYSVLDREFYIPAADQIALQSANNKQGRGEIVTPDQAEAVRELLLHESIMAFGVYDALLNDPASENHKEQNPSIARELARIGLTLNTYTQWYWKTDLRNLFHFLGLRADPHAQYEIRVYADKLLEITRDWVPMSTKAFEDYQLNAVTFSAQQMALLRAAMQFTRLPVEGANGDIRGLSPREYQDLLSALKEPS
jgi:thymidylate synthase (FAD)